MNGNSKIALLASLLTLAFALPGVHGETLFPGEDGCLFPTQEALEAALALVPGKWDTCGGLLGYKAYPEPACVPGLWWACLSEEDISCNPHLYQTYSSDRWSFQFGSLRDPILPDVHYSALWTMTGNYMLGAYMYCWVQVTGCDLTVSNGAHFTQLTIPSLGGTRVFTGEYLGLPVHGGGIVCSPTGASIDTWVGNTPVGPVAGAIHLTGST